MILDAPAFKPVLTPEAALGIVAKSLQHQGWPKFEVTDIKLVFTPYYVFSFDVIAQEGQSPSGKTAINAYNGDLNDFVPMLFDRPLKTIKQTDETAEVEHTAISQSEAKDAATAKLASQVGLKRDAIAVSAIRKIYVPSFRIWVDVADDTRKFEIDALLGVPAGLEGLPQKAQTWSDSLKSVLDKMKNPAGWGELFQGLVSGGGSPFKRYALLGAVIIVLLVLVAMRGGLLGGSGGIACQISDIYLGNKPFLGLGTQQIVPEFGANNTVFVKGTCLFTNQGSKPVNMAANIFIKKGQQIIAVNSTSVATLPPSDQAVPKEFELRWKQGTAQDVDFSYERVI